MCTADRLDYTTHAVGFLEEQHSLDKRQLCSYLKGGQIIFHQFTEQQTVLTPA